MAAADETAADDAAGAGAEPEDKLQRPLLFTEESYGKPQGPLTWTFYVYRAANRSAGAKAMTKTMTNVNVGDLPFVMWYLHNEVISQMPWKYNIDRIQRFRITMRNGMKLYKAKGAQFGPHVTFEGGRCTRLNCDQIWNSLGFVVGCATLPPAAGPSAYYSSWLTRPLGRECPPRCNDAVQYSLPGPCPLMPEEGKTQDCSLRQPGGLCNSDKLLGTDGASCTYFLEPAGEILLDEVTGMGDRGGSWSAEGFQEYDATEDKGVGGASFWDGRLDPQACSARMKRVQHLFRDHYPEFPESLMEPPCDSI